MLDAAELIRFHRLAAGLSQRALARRAKTSSATLSRYESGQIDPSTRTLNRILHACRARRRRWASLAELTPAIAKLLRRGRPADAWRVVGEFLDDDRAADDREVLATVGERPAESGDRRADALAAALGEYLCVRRQLAPPAWSQAPIEVVPWWFIAQPNFHGVALRESPISFARRGIFITAGALERV